MGEEKRDTDEVVVQYDEERVTPEVRKVIEAFETLLSGAVGCRLDNDFGAFKNNLTSHCKGDYIFQLDADEMPNREIVAHLPLILGANPEVDLFLVPRVNTVEGFTEDHVKKWGWRVNEKNWINWPDYQSRIFKNSFHIKWENKVHERIVGYATQSAFPPEDKFAILHHKKIEKQEQQNTFYDHLS